MRDDRLLSSVAIARNSSISYCMLNGYNPMECIKVDVE